MKRNLYSENWSDVIRPLILKRDNYKCKRCKIKHRSIGYYENNKIFVECDEFMEKYAIKIGFKLVKIFLQVHHINTNKEDNNDNNLITLCQRCHLAEDKEYRRLKRHIIYKSELKHK
jgi:5-methylcytosine-specific restriction endonuclease McrA